MELASRLVNNPLLLLLIILCLFFVTKMALSEDRFQRLILGVLVVAVVSFILGAVWLGAVLAALAVVSVSVLVVTRNARSKT